MSRHYEELARFEREGFTIIVDKTWEELSVRDCFDDSCHDIGEIIEKIENYTFDWFMLRVRAMLNGHELGSSYLGGCLYENARDVLTDGTAEDIIGEALKEAREQARQLVGALRLVVDSETV